MKQSKAISSALRPPPSSLPNKSVKTSLKETSMKPNKIRNKFVIANLFNLMKLLKVEADSTFVY